MARTTDPQILLLMADVEAYPGLWVTGLKLWHWEPGPPISQSLRSDLRDWIDAYTKYYYENGDAWITASKGAEWHRQGWRLFARLNRELYPKGYLVLPAFDTDESARIRQRIRRFEHATDVLTAKDAEVSEIWDLVAKVETSGATPT